MKANKDHGIITPTKLILLLYCVAETRTRPDCLKSWNL